MTAMPTWRPLSDVVVGGGMRFEIVVVEPDGTERIFTKFECADRSRAWTHSEALAQIHAASARKRNDGCQVFIRAVAP